MFNILGWLIFGLIVGALARFLVPGRDPLGCFGTLALGVAGSMVGGFLASLIFGHADELGEGGWNFEPSGFIGALIGSVLLLLIFRQFRKDKV